MRNFFQSFINGLTKPHSVVLITAAMSFIAWLIPTGSDMHTGYIKKEPLTLVALSLILSWYFCIFVFTYFSYNIGKGFKPSKSFDYYTEIHSKRVYFIYSIIGSLGFGYSMIKIVGALGISGIFRTLFQDFQGNAIQDVLYEDYSIGIPSLRYVLVLAFGIALYRIQRYKEYTILNFYNLLVFIAYTIIFGRRLQIIEGLAVYLCLANRNRDFLKTISKKFITISLVLMVGLVTVSTVVRNFNTFKERGNSNPLTATFANALEYLGTPAQATVAIGNNIGKASQGVYYRRFTDIDDTLQTNSALSELIYDWGWGAYVYAIIFCAFFGFLAGVLSKNKNNYLFTAYPVIIYSFSEMWRIFLFTAGIFYTLFTIALIIPITIVFLNRKV